VNYSLTLLIHFSTGSKTIILLLVWFGKEKPNKITKQIAGEDSGFRFSEWFSRKMPLELRFLVCFCTCLVPLHTSPCRGGNAKISSLTHAWGAGLNFKDLLQLGSSIPALLDTSPLSNRARENSRLYLKIWRSLRLCALGLLLFSLLLKSRKQNSGGLESDLWPEVS